MLKGPLVLPKGLPPQACQGLDGSVYCFPVRSEPPPPPRTAPQPTGVMRAPQRADAALGLCDAVRYREGPQGEQWASRPSKRAPSESVPGTVVGTVLTVITASPFDEAVHHWCCADTNCSTLMPPDLLRPCSP